MSWGDIADEQKEKVAIPARLAMTTGTAALNNTKSILYIEDNPANRQLMVAICMTNPHLNLITAATAELGLDSVTQEKPALIMMDINLPGMDGFEACKILKHNEPTANIPVIAVSANDMNDNVEKVKEAGFADYISKLFKVSEVLAAISRVLDDKTEAVVVQT